LGTCGGVPRAYAAGLNSYARFAGWHWGGHGVPPDVRFQARRHFSRFVVSCGASGEGMAVGLLPNCAWRCWACYTRGREGGV
jgi:hypothetical protein